MYRTVEVTRDRFVAIPPEMTQEVKDTQLPATVDAITLGTAYKERGVLLQMCNGQLQEISRLGQTDD